MEWINEIWIQIAQYISVPYMLTFILLAYLVKEYFGKFLQKITKFEWKTVYTVLILATITAVPFLIWTDTTWAQVLLSYAVGTSLHELIFRYIGDLFIKE